MSLNKALIALIFLFSSSVFAGTVMQVKNNRALIRLDGDRVNVGQRVVVVDASGTETAVLTIRAVKDGRAIGQVIRGSAVAGQKTQASTSSSASPVKKSGGSSSSQAQRSSRSTPTKPSSKKIRASDKRLFVQGRMLMNSISAKQKNADSPPMEETVDMSGSNFGVSLGMDFPLSDAFAIRASGGYEMLNVSGDLNILGCKGQTSSLCDVSINYLTVSAALKAQKIYSDMILWGGVGATIKQPISKASTALNEDNIQMANSIFGTFGLDYFLSSTNFIPAALEYHHSLNTSDTVPKINQIAVSVGYGWTY